MEEWVPWITLRSMQCHGCPEVEMISSSCYVPMDAPKTFLSCFNKNPVCLTLYLKLFSYSVDLNHSRSSLIWINAV